MVKDKFDPIVSAQYGKEWQALVHDMLNYNSAVRPKPVEILRRLKKIR